MSVAAVGRIKNSPPLIAVEFSDIRSSLCVQVFKNAGGPWPVPTHMVTMP